MSDYLEGTSLDERDMNPEFKEAEQEYRDQASKLWTEAEELKSRTRRRVDDTPEERQSAYMADYQSINNRFERLANGFTQRVETQRRADKRLLQEGTGEKFADFVVSLSTKPAEELDQIMQTAQRTGARDLARACAQVALDKRRFQLFEEWAQGEPELAAAMKRLRTTPGLDQLRTRTLSMRPPRAGAETLEPTQGDRERVVSQSAAQEAARAAFFGLPRRQVGRYVS
jgi:hypothetical protein